MAVDLHMLEMEASHEDGNWNRAEPDPRTTTTRSGGGDAAEAVVVYKKGAWSKEEDEKLRGAVDKYGLRNWVAIEKFSGLGRPAKNCRLRWLNYLRPNLKKYPFTQEEEELIFQLHSKYGNSWSRIASKLPGRSDNEIKNFWHKKAKKRHKHHLPIYPPPTKENLPDEQTLPSTSIHSPQIQPSTPNAVNTSSRPNDASLIHSPRIAISTPESSHVQQQSHSAGQTTPTSQTQNFLLSPHPITQSTETPFSIPNAPSPSMGSNEFTVLRKPPILSSPQGPLRRFSRATSKLSPNSTQSVVSNASAFLPQDSSSQMQFSSTIESPRSPLKLKLSPRIPPARCSAQMNAQATDSQVASFPAFQHGAPPSPLKLCLSIPMPSESFFQPKLSIPNSTVQVVVDTDNNIPQESSQTIKTEPPSIQVESDTNSNLEIMEELREAQARVRFLKKKLSLRRTSNKRGSLEEISETDLTGSALDGDSSESTTKDCPLLRTSSGTKNFLDGDILRVEAPLKDPRKKDMTKKFPRRKSDILRGAWEGHRLCKLQRREHSDKKCTERSLESEKATHYEPAESFPREEFSLGEIFKKENSMTFEEQRHSIDFFDHLNIQNTSNVPKSNCFDNTIGGLYKESSNFLQDSSLDEDLFGRRSGIQVQLSSQRNIPLIDAFNPVYSQSTATTLLKPDQDEYFDCSFGQEISESLERKLAEDGFMDGDLGVKSVLCESNLLYPASDILLDPNYLVSAPIVEQEYFRSEEFPTGTPKLSEPNVLQYQLPAADLIDNLVDSGYLVGFEQVCPQGEQYYLQSSACEFDEGGMKTDCASGEPWKQKEPSRDQSLMQVLLIDNLWPQDQVASQDQTFSTNRLHSGGVDLMESKNWNDRSGCGYAGEALKHEEEHDQMNTMSEELSSLLEFFPTTNQTLEWYNIGNAIHDTKTSDEFNMGLNPQRSSTSQPPLTTGDYL